MSEEEEEEEFLEFLEIFKEESLGRMVNVSKALDALPEADPDGRSALLDEIDRELHTIKGSARLLGFSQLGALVHELEGLARAVREQPDLNLDLLVEACDILSTLVQESAEEGHDVDDPELRERVEAALQEDAAPGPELSAGARQPVPLHEEVSELRRPGAQGFSVAPPGEDLAEGRGRSDPNAETSTTLEIPRRDDVTTKVTRSGRRPPPPVRRAPTGPAPTRPGAGHTPGSGGTNSWNAGSSEPATRPGVTSRVDRAEDETVRVRSSRLAQLDEIVSELTLARQRLETYELRMQTLVHGVEEGTADAGDVSQTVRRILQDFRSDTLQVHTATKDLQQLAVDVRLRPVSYLFDQLPREARRLARSLNKRVQVRIRGEDTEMDRVILDNLRPLLIHLLRNALDHGIETPAEREARGKPPEGLLELSAGQEGNRVVIRLADDGGGINTEKVKSIALKRGIIDAPTAEQMSEEDANQLIFAPGFSTRSVATEVSGRGVGMNAVRTGVEDLKGDVGVGAREGGGTTITIRLPLTLLISRVTLVRTGGQRFALPTESVVESVRLPTRQVIEFGGRATMLWRARSIPVVRLNAFLARTVLPDPDHLRVLVVHHAGEWVGLVVEELLEERQVVVKRLGWPLELIPWVSGAVHDPSGEIALQLHVPEVFLTLRSNTQRFKPAAVADEGSPSILVVDDSIVSRQLVGRVVDALGFEPLMAVDGVDAWGILERVRPMMIVTDLEMPRLDGLGLIRRVRSTRRLQGMPIVVVSNRGSEQDRQAGLEAGADAYITKPEFNQQTFRRTVERML